MKPHVVIVGSFNRDLTWRCAGFPAPGETTVGTFATGPGGKGSNQAVAAARAGGRVAFVGALGRDTFGREAAAFLRAEGVAARIAWKNLPTGNAAILVNRAGQNQIIVALGANAALARRDVPAALLRHARVVVGQHETNLAVNAHAFRLARRHGATTVLNPAPLRADFNPGVLRLVDVLIPNEGEFAALLARLPRGVKLWAEVCGGPPEARRLGRLPGTRLQALCRAVGVPAVILTLGARGCFVSLATGGWRLPAHPVRALDTTGAGDAFVGAFAAALAGGSGDILASARFANAAAALAVTRPGTAPAMPRLRQILALLRARDRTA